MVNFFQPNSDVS